MLQEDIALEVQQYSRKSIPVMPTLVIGLGDYGRTVGEQLAARLILTEESLREVGLKGQLLVKKENDMITPGLVRIMHLDWRNWFNENFQPNALLQDINIPGAMVAEMGTPSRMREEEPHPDDWVDARKALVHPRLQDALYTASLPLRTHDNPMRIGFQIHGRSQNFEMRVVVICALREATSAELGIDIIQLLGKAYVKRSQVARGIHIFCYVGGTSWEEHAQAYFDTFDTEPDDTSDFDSLLDSELQRILPISKQQNLSQIQNDKLLYKLKQAGRRAYLDTFGIVFDDTSKFDNLLDTALQQILPVSKRQNLGQIQNDNMLDKLKQVWYQAYLDTFGAKPDATSDFDRLLDIELQHMNDNMLDKLERIWHTEQPQTIEACYLIDSQLANRVAAVQRREDEPDEVIVATALAINLFITGNADQAVRQARTSRWDMKVPLGEPGLFSTLGVAAYSLDHPRLRRLVYNYVVGKFLEKAQPVMAGDSPTSFLIGESKERLLNEDLETELSLDLQESIVAYRKRIMFKALQLHTHSPDCPIQTNIDYRNAVRVLSKLPSANIYTIQGALESIFGEAISDSQMLEEELYGYMMRRRQEYQEQLENTFQHFYAQLFDKEKAPLTFLYRFTKKSLEVLTTEANAVQAPSTEKDRSELLDEQKQIAQREAEVSTHRLTERTVVIRRELQRKPNIIATASRVLLLSPILVILAVTLSTIFYSALAPWFNFFDGAFQRLLPSLYALPLLPFWVICLLIAACLWIALFLIVRWYQRYRLRHHLQWFVARYEALLEKIDTEGWRWALTDQQRQLETSMHYLEGLCQPQGTISKLRDKLLAEQFIVRDHILERIFFDERLQVGLKDVSAKLAANDKLWAQRARILRELVDPKQSKNARELELWLREQASEIHKSDTHLIVDLVESFLVYQTAQRLEEIWQDLSAAAALFLQRTTALQDDPAIDTEMFGVHNQEVLAELEAILQRADVNLLPSVDRLRWIFMHVQTGLELSNIKFSAELML